MTKGISLPLDFLYVLLLFLLISVLIIGIFIITSKDLIESIKSGEIYKKIESMLKGVIGR